MSEPVTKQELAEALDDVVQAILSGLSATITSITPGNDGSEAMQRFSATLSKIEERAEALRERSE